MILYIKTIALMVALSGCYYTGPSTEEVQTFTRNPDGTW